MEKCMGVIDEVLREKGEKKKQEEEGELWNVLEFGGMAGRKKGRKKENKERVRVRVWRRKKEGEKREKKERNAVCGG